MPMPTRWKVASRRWLAVASTALSFVLAPILSHFLLGEKFNTQYFVGVGLLLCGIVLTIKS